MSFRDADGSVGSRDSYTHWIHWYPAKMFYRIPQQILNTLEMPAGSVLLDPFCGSGTVLLEGMLKGFQPVGCDVNPLARLISAVKTTLVDPEHLEKVRQEVLAGVTARQSEPSPSRTLDFWFRRSSRKALEALHSAILSSTTDDPRIRNFCLVSLSNIVRRSSLADPNIAPPVRLKRSRVPAADKRYSRALDASENLTPAKIYEMFATDLTHSIRRMERLRNKTLGSKVEVLGPESHASNTLLPSESVDVVLTSPPYCGAQKYVRSLRLEMLLLGYTAEQIAEADRLTLGTERVGTLPQLPASHTMPAAAADSIAEIYSRNRIRGTMALNYFSYLAQFACECRRVLKPGGLAFVTFGSNTIAGCPVDTASIFATFVADLQLDVLATLVDTIPSRGLMTKRHRTAGTIRDERVVCIRKPTSECH